MKHLLPSLLLLFTIHAFAAQSATDTAPPYQPARVVYDFYLDNPAKMSSAFQWVRALYKPLTSPPYSFDPEELDVKVVIHGAEIVTVAKKNYEQYRDIVERMRYYASLGVEFKVCSFAARDYDYNTEDFYEFVEVVPSAFTELAHWQQQGYALITPKVYLRTQLIEDIR
jgi:intracellular sulfur oxidation DsrE/DsrF family protein